jgi:hypothetical protein
MPLDDDRPLDDLCLVRKTHNGIWHWQKRGDYEFWVRHEAEEWFWKSLYKYASLEDIDGGCWLTRAQNRSEAIKRVKENQAFDLKPWMVMQRLIGRL